MTQPDFGGYATKNDVTCSDGRTIRRDAFKHDHGKVVPLVWQHGSNDPANILGHAELENREDGVYARCYFNDSGNAKNAKNLIIHKAINSLSIYANKLGQIGKDVMSGTIREVSLVLSGANPGALIDTISFAHDEFGDDEIDEAIIYSGESLSHSEEVKDDVQEQEKEEKEIAHEEGGEETIGDILATLNDKQKAAVGVLLENMDDDDEEDENAEHSDKEDTSMGKRNVFDKDGEEQNDKNDVLTHDDFVAIQEAARKCGSFKEAFMTHMEDKGFELSHAGGFAAGYGLENVGYLFPDAQKVAGTPTFIKRDTGWVGGVLNGCRHTPFSRIKSMAADITPDEARAKGYVTGNEKTEEVFELLTRTTTPTTIYKKQKLDRDDVVDITDMDVVAWLKAEMRMMLDEEIARAVLLGDGRSALSEDKISATNIRPIAFDDNLYAHKVELANDAVVDIIDEILRAQENYKGSGNTTFYCSQHVMMDMLLLKDTQGYRVYKTKEELAAGLGVNSIVPVPVMTDSTVYDGTHELYGVIVDLNDYVIGADKGGAINMFDDFDIDYNQYKYLIETRISGALVQPKSALVFVTDTTSGAMG